MRKSIFTLAPVVAALLAGSGVAQAASNAQMTITANVVAATCDVSLSNASLDLGNYSKSAFTTVATPVTASVKTFTVGLSNCETPAKAGDKASLIVTGQTLGGNPNIFNSTGTNTGVMLSETATPTKYITNGQKLAVATAGATPTAGDFNAKSLSLQAGLASTSTTPDIGMVSAPILFSFAYN
ncbi:fimbrial protein [Serratia fonticola]|jgi:major type 1 subunit fimbrin (pilin)|uniref:fimbrial protein n=1 Tax=Serratia fonticola TaxID=47917 RepID=UPI0014153541|nr:type 1 fimbrial protein [Serratia fonticola]MBC3380736.1 type 1 fimbrial protein [Serratia fonticola]MBP0997049.1 type 1 fimbrial protein [Serratia fonticola]MBP1002717.1 type 1 fimbrial protein [Serratia fonticola]MBP1012508.1 type 1 fimbrial protein [Serratia fonticola]MBP1018758.1 type 1 fimbrial protein [Serratia fonticola]